ncbi:hypothetical protein TIFTF001_028407 [Ficus carica]|uniref:Uncharacterized protein n=1 Tax=Ficus carica TaxID=3494 RepID=A0AA88DPX4_FICCA|nr:hypothetical protein TIFTF001_028407 [Ficus carica]
MPTTAYPIASHAGLGARGISPLSQRPYTTPVSPSFRGASLLQVIDGGEIGQSRQDYPTTLGVAAEEIFSINILALEGGPLPFQQPLLHTRSPSAQRFKGWTNRRTRTSRTRTLRLQAPRAPSNPRVGEEPADPRRRKSLQGTSRA